jgi:hypothetical protein
VPTLLGQQLFPLDNPWNQNISNAPVADNSAAIIAHIGASTRLTPNWGADDPLNGSNPLYGMPFNIVHGNGTGTVNVIIDNYPGESDLQPVPIPASAVLEGDYQNGPNPNGGGYQPDQRGDSHLIVWDEDNNISYELYGVTRPSDPTLFPNRDNVELPHSDGLWHAAQETVWNMNTDTFRTLGETSADAAGLAILTGAARPDEGLPVSQGGQGVIDHALRVTLPGRDINPQYIYPGSHMVSTSPGSDNLPLGSRLRLADTPAIDTLINDMPPESQILARAMQQYGLIVADIGSAMYVSGASASVDASNTINFTWDLTDIFASNGLEALNAGDFQVVNLRPMVTGLSMNQGPAGSSLTITGQNFSGAAGQLSVFFGTTVASSVTVVSDTQLSVVVPSGSGTVHVTVQSGVNEIDYISGNPNANVNAPIFGYGTSAQTPADLFTFTRGSPGGPAVIDSEPNGNVTGPVDDIRFTFDESIRAHSFEKINTSIASFTDPCGNSIPVLSVTPVPGTDKTQFDVAFAPQTQAGTYTLVIGPRIRDRFGREMDQDGDGKGGQIPDDQYTATFTIEGASILRFADNGAPTNPRTSVRVTFDGPVDPTTFDPSGNPIPVHSVTPVAGSNNTAFDIASDPQTANGSYSMTVGATIVAFYYGTAVADLLSGTGMPLLDATMVINNGGGNTLMDHHGHAGEMPRFNGLGPTLETTDYNPALGDS